MNDDNLNTNYSENNSSEIKQKASSVASEKLSFHSGEEYVAFIRETIKENTPPKAWLSLKMLTDILEKLQAPDYFKKMGYESLESFLADPRFNKLWRADKQNNSPFLVRYSHGLEIVQYIGAVEQGIRELYFQKEHTPVTTTELTEILDEAELSISYAHMGYPSFEVFLSDKRFSRQWIVEAQEDYTILLKPVFDPRENFLDKTFSSLKKYFARQPQKPTKDRLVQFFKRGIASKVYQKYGFTSLEELAMDSTFAPLRDDNPRRRDPHENENQPSTDDTQEPSKESLKEEEAFAEQVNLAYSQLAENDPWVSLTAIASRISSVRKKVQAIGYPSLSKFIQAKAEDMRWKYRYTDATPPDFQIQWLDNPGPPPEKDHPADYYTEEHLINEIREQVKQSGDTWVLLAVIGQYIPDIKARVERLGYDSLGAFIKDRTREGNWVYTYIDDVPAKLSIKLKDSLSDSPVKQEKIETSQREIVETIAPEEEKTSLTSYLLEPGFCLKLEFQDNDLLKEVASLAEEEVWHTSNEPYGILRYYLTSTLVRCAVQGFLCVKETNCYLFHTGLWTSEGQAILGEVTVQSLPAGGTALYFTAAEVKAEGDSVLPPMAQYYNFKKSIPLEAYIINPQYPLLQTTWRELGVEEDEDTFAAKVAYSWKRLNRQLRLAYSAYDREQNEMHLLLPLVEKGEKEACQVLEVVWRKSGYEPIALLTLEEAYKRARVVSKINTPFPKM